MLTLENCRLRQQRLLRHMERERLDLVILANPKTIYYFSGALTDRTVPQLFAIDSSGWSQLITDKEPKQAAAEQVDLYTSYTIERPFNRTTMMEEAVSLLRTVVMNGVAGIESDFVPAAVGQAAGGRKADITPAIDAMRRVKDPDEIESIRNTIALAEAGYAAVKGKLAPGMTELDVYLIFHEALAQHAGTSVDLRGDFACGTRAIRGGGPPTERRLAEGDLYILDIFPFYRGYLCDLTRTFVVGRPSPLQREAWEVVRGALDLAAQIIRPGVTGGEVYRRIRNHLEAFQPCAGSFWHHLGHGFGMNGWEYPWLTPGGERHMIQEGETLAVEPAVYGECIQGGIRLEHDYLVGKDGVTTLDQFPLEL